MAMQGFVEIEKRGTYAIEQVIADRARPPVFPVPGLRLSNNQKSPA
jgi:hypothetical protein